MNEIWKDIQDWEEYSVSNYGRVFSKYKNKLLSICEKDNGYKMVGLHRNKKVKHKMVHRLVAEAFIPNPDNLPEVNHIDENKSNNCVDNLEWVTHRQNCNHGTRNIRVGENQGKPVLQFTKDGEFIKEYKSLADAAKENGVLKSNISKCCNNKPHCKTIGGYIWRFKN